MHCEQQRGIERIMYRGPWIALILLQVLLHNAMNDQFGSHGPTFWISFTHLHNVRITTMNYQNKPLLTYPLYNRTIFESTGKEKSIFRGKEKEKISTTAHDVDLWDELNRGMRSLENVLRARERIMYRGHGSRSYCDKCS